MALELITGSNGAGKTCYAVYERLRRELGREVTYEAADGTPRTASRRLVVAGIRALQLEHEALPHPLTGESISAEDVERWNERSKADPTLPVHERLPESPPQAVPALLQNWWLWCQPGDLIVIDEAQWLVRRGTLNATPPIWIERLAIHRHYGIDFIFITPNRGLLPAWLRDLIGLHRHVRSFFGTSFCAIYAWDHCSSTERLQTATKQMWRRRRSMFALYKSTVAVVKPPSTGRAGVIAAVVLLAGAALGLRSFVTGFRDPAAPVAHASSGAPGSPGPSGSPSSSRPPRSRVAGCWSVGDTCDCFDESGRPVRVDLQTCRVSSSSFAGLVEWEPSRAKRIDVPDAPAPASVPDAPMLAFQ